MLLDSSLADERRFTADRSHHQITGNQMKFITICDYTGIIECEIFSQTYRRFGLETVRNPVVEVEARVTPFDNGVGCTLEVLRVGKPRSIRPSCMAKPPIKIGAPPPQPVIIAMPGNLEVSAPSR
jgi:hypothetical protein